MAEIVSSVGSNVADDYSDLAAWWTDKKGDIVSADQVQIAELRGEEHDAGNAVNLLMSFADCTVDSTRYYHIRTMTGAEFHGDFDDIASTARLTNDGYSGIVCTVEYTRFEDFVIYNISGTISYDCIRASATGNYAKNCGIHNCETIGDTGGNITLNGFYVLKCINCVVNDIYGQQVGSSAKAITIYGIFADYVYNCTVANLEADNDSTGIGNATAIGIGQLGAAPKAVNNSLVFAVTASCATGNATAIATDYTWAGTEDYNADEDGSTTGVNSITITPASEVTDTAKATFDCHLKAGADCIDEGTDLSGEGYSDDIDGVTRTGTWDIGADQYVGAPPTGWTHKIHGVAPANMAKVNSVAKANIGKINQT